MSMDRFTQKSLAYQEGHCPVDYGQIWYRHYQTVSTNIDPVTVVVLHGGPGCPSDYLFGLSALSSHYNVVFYDQV